MKILRTRRTHGFTVLELLVSCAVFLIISGAVLGSLMGYQKQHRGQEIRVSLESTMRGAVQLMTQEIGQAGLPAAGVDDAKMASPIATLSAAVGIGATTMTVSTPSGVALTGIIPGEVISIDNGKDKQEKVQVHSVSGSTITIEYGFLKAHAANSPIFVLGTFPGGVLYPKTGWFYPASPEKNLYVFGDLNGDGNTMVLSRYSCPTSSGGSFTRQRFEVLTGNAIDASPVSLVENVTSCNFSYVCAYPGSQPADCKADDPVMPTQAVTPGTDAMLNQSDPRAAAGTAVEDYYLVVGIGFSITADSQTPDPQTGKTVSLSKNFLNIQPRNIIACNHQLTSTVAENLELQQFYRDKGVFAKIAAGQI